MAQIHALLFLSPEPLPAADIADTLGVARSNVSTSLRELQAWGVVRVIHHLGDRRDHFVTTGDAWEMFRVILDERKRREIDPTIAGLEACLQLADTDRGLDDRSRERMDDLLNVLHMLSAWYERMTRRPVPVQKKVLRMGTRIRKLVG